MTSLDRVGEWMRLMTKTYSPRDLREACYLRDRDDAVWIMEHCADTWEATEKNFQSMRRLACSCYVVTQEQLAEWNRLQGLP